MAWHRDSITPGEINALRQAALRACGNDTTYPHRAGASRVDAGECYNMARWLTTRLGGYVGVRRGHFAWVSADGSYALDLTGNHGDGYTYGPNEGYEPYPTVDNERSARFIKRANVIFDDLEGLLKVALDYMGDAFPAEEPQRAEELDNQYWHDEPTHSPQDRYGEFKFVYGNGNLEISPSHDHTELAEHAGVATDSTGPVAVGWAVVNNGAATWEVQTNINIKSLERVFKEYGKQVGWKWGGITNIEGEPISSEFAPEKAALLRFAFVADHLYLGRISHSELLLQADELEDPVVGWIRMTGTRAEVWPVHIAAIPSLCEWAEDAGFTLYAANDNNLKTQETLETFDRGTQDGQGEQNPLEGPAPQDFDIHQRTPAGLYQCPSCNRLFPSWHTYQRHRRDEEGEGDTLPVRGEGKFPELDMDKPSPFQPHFTPQQPEIVPLAGYNEASRVAGFEGGRESDQYWVAYHSGSPVGYAQLRNAKVRRIVAHSDIARGAIWEKILRYSQKEPKDLLSGSVPFIFDVQNDQITVGKPGQRTADIPGRFTPGGIVEGVYEPGGKVLIRTMTNMPYTVRHLVELWYYQHPELTVTQVHLRDDKGGDTKLAKADEVGNQITTLVHADPAVSNAARALLAAGGGVYAVGGCIRDALMGKDPKDIDLMVNKLPAPLVERTLEALPGRVDYTGKDFGVFRYRFNNHEVEIALPRKEKSTGPGHTDFDVQADHTLTPHEDLYRRDFTVNAMAVDLSSGKLIDPYNGVNDILDSRLRTVSPESLSEDPLRILRALVAHGRHDLHPDEATKAQMQVNAASLAHEPPERIKEELDKLLMSKHPEKGIRLAQETGCLEHFLPEVARCFGYDQNNPHHEKELGDHLLSVLERVCEKSEDPDLRLAGLLHDIGKPDSMWVDPVTGGGHYYEKRLDDGTVLGADHEKVGSDMTRSLMQRLRYPNKRIDRVSDLVLHHMWPAFTTERGARRHLHRVGDHADDLMTLRWADQGGKSDYPTDNTLSLDTQQRLMDRVRNAQQPTSQAALAINGNDLIQAGIQPGPQMGQILKKLTDDVVDDPRKNQRNTLLTLALQYANI